MLVYSGEKRFVAVDLANDPGVVAGATLTGTPTVVVAAKHGTTDPATPIVVSTPAAPAISGTQVRFWGDFASVERGRYAAQVTVTLSNGETAKASPTLVVQ